LALESRDHQQQVVVMVALEESWVLVYQQQLEEQMWVACQVQGPGGRSRGEGQMCCAMSSLLSLRLCMLQGGRISSIISSAAEVQGPRQEQQLLRLRDLKMP
jgi:hypothetical protein